MLRTTVIAAALGLAATTASFAESIEYPAPVAYPFQRSYLRGDAVAIVPFRRLFPIRVHTTPQRQPYYNVPPYAVITPY